MYGRDSSGKREHSGHRTGGLCRSRGPPRHAIPVMWRTIQLLPMATTQARRFSAAGHGRRDRLRLLSQACPGTPGGFGSLLA